MQLLPAKEQAEMRLRYVNTVMTSETLKNHIDNWVEHLPRATSSGNDPMDVGAVDDNDNDNDDDDDDDNNGQTGARDTGLAAKLTKAIHALRETRKKGFGQKKGDNKGTKGNGREKGVKGRTKGGERGEKGAG